MWLFTMFSTPRTADAEIELRAELREFAHDGLVQLQLDLRSHAVMHGTWEGCVLSYRAGGPGSVSCDRKGRRGNAFTRFWDTERVSPQAVLQAIEDEIASRRHHAAPAAQTSVAPY